MRRAGRRAGRAVVACALVAVGVGGGALAIGCKGKTETVHRAGSGAAVEVVAGPVAGPDGGAGKGARGGGAGAGVATASAPVGDEVEPDDTDDTATPIPLGSTMRGRIDPPTDVDRYRVEVTAVGALAVSLSGVDGVDLSLELVDRDGNVVAHSDRGKARVREGLPNFGVTPGRYTLVVRGKVAQPPKPPRAKKGKKGAPPNASSDAGVSPVATAAGAAPVYELAVAFSVPGDGIEHEPNDDRGTANDVIVGDTVTGYVGWTGDVDTWKLSVEALSAKNAVDLEVSAVEGVALELGVADGLGVALVDRKGPRGAPMTVRGFVPAVAPGAPPFRYLVVQGDRSNPETTYQLHVTAHVLGPDDEVEPNDTPDHPQPVPADRTIVHATWTPGDVDCFALDPADVPHGVTITIDASGDVDLSADLRVDGQVVAKSAHPGRGAAEGVSATIPAKARAVACVRGADAGATTGGTYDFVIHDGDDHADAPAQP